MSGANKTAALAFASGLVFAASSPPSDLDAGILVGLGGFAYALDEGAPTLRRGALAGIAFGLGANLLALRFVPQTIARFTSLPFVAGVVALVLLALGQAVPWMLGGALGRILVRRALAPSWLAFALAVYFATFVPALFPWTPAGGLARIPILLQTAEHIGERGTSALLAAAMALVALGVRRAIAAAAGARISAARPAAFGVGLLLAIASHGLLAIRRIDAIRAAAPAAKVALIDPDFPPMLEFEEEDARRRLSTLARATRDGEEAGATLTIWPESAYPYTLAHGIRLAPRGDRSPFLHGVRGPILTGVYLKKSAGIGTNGAIFIQRDHSIAPPYDKRHLLWFGETVPFGDVFPVLRKIFARGTGLDPGAEQIAFETDAVRFAVLNCYEDTLPQAGREAMAVRPNLLVNITNDTWFSGSAEGELHLRLATLRAIETRRDLVRAVNRGPTSHVDAAGRIRARYDGPAAGASPQPLLVDAALVDRPLTLYARFGDMPLVLLVAAGLAAQALRRRAATK